MQEPPASSTERRSAARPGPRSRPRRDGTGLGLLLGGPLLGLLLVGLLSLATISEVRVGGPQDERVTRAHELVADTTAASQNLSPLRGTLLLLPEADGTPEEATLRSQVDAAEVRYRDGHAYWDNHLSDPGLRDSLLVVAHEPVATFFRVIHEALWPAMDRGSRAEADQIVRRQLLPLLDQHDEAMHRVSDQAAELTQATQRRADDAITLRMRLFVAVLAAVMLLVAVAAAAALRLTRRDDSMPTGTARSTAPDGAEARGPEGADPVWRPDVVTSEAEAPTLAAALELCPAFDDPDAATRHGAELAPEETPAG